LEGVKQFHIGEYRLAEALDQLGIDYKTWLHANVKPEHHLEEVNRHCLKLIFDLPLVEQRIAVLSLPNSEQIPAIFDYFNTIGLAGQIDGAEDLEDAMQGIMDGKKIKMDVGDDGAHDDFGPDEQH
jgi:hypothetical protein